ncbi:MAG TPA: hypothetical protein VF189_00760 [Patescibacteria group bacterium]
MYETVAVVGPLSSGKGILIDLLKSKGFVVYSLSNVVREKCTIWGLPHTRKNLQDVGNKIRQQFGPSMLAELSAASFKKENPGKAVFDGIRNPAELKYLKKEFKILTIGITANQKTRFELLLKRNREGDPKTWEEFLKLEERDRGIGEESFGQQVDACLKMADVIFENNGSIEDFNRNISYFLRANKLVA